MQPLKPKIFKKVSVGNWNGVLTNGTRIWYHTSSVRDGDAFLLWRDVRAVEGTGLENRRGASLRGFESHSLRQLYMDLQKYPRGRRGSPAKGVGWIKPARGFKSLLLRHVTVKFCFAVTSFLCPHRKRHQPSTFLCHVPESSDLLPWVWITGFSPCEVWRQRRPSSNGHKENPPIFPSKRPAGLGGPFVFCRAHDKGGSVSLCPISIRKRGQTSYRPWAIMAWEIFLKAAMSLPAIRS